MGYPMTYERVIGRGYLRGGYDTADPKAFGRQEQELADKRIRWIAGDLRRLEIDTRDEIGLAHFAKISGATPEQVKLIFDEFFKSYEPYGEIWSQSPSTTG